MNALTKLFYREILSLYGPKGAYAKWSPFHTDLYNNLVFSESLLSIEAMNRLGYIGPDGSFTCPHHFDF